MRSRTMMIAVIFAAVWLQGCAPHAPLASTSPSASAPAASRPAPHPLHRWTLPMPGEPLVVGLGAYHVANPIAVATDGRPGRQSSLDLADRVLLAATYWRTNLTMRQVGPPFGVSHSTAHRVIDTG